MLLAFHHPGWPCAAPCKVITDGFVTLTSTLSVGRGTWLASKRQQSRASFFRQDYDLGCYPFTTIGAWIRVFHWVHPSISKQPAEWWEGGMLATNQKANRLPPNTCVGPLLCDNCTILSYLMHEWHPSSPGTSNKRVHVNLIDRSWWFWSSWRIWYMMPWQWLINYHRNISISPSLIWSLDFEEEEVQVEALTILFLETYHSCVLVSC